MKTLALTMIVGPGDGKMLDRCLKSFDIAKCVDQLVIVATTNDEEVAEVARRYTDGFSVRPWTSERYPFGDFAGARNAALDEVTTDYWMWLDADDVLSTGAAEKLLELKRRLTFNPVDVCFMSYALEFAADNVATKSIMRERIVRTESGIRWRKPVHEQLDTDWSIHTKAPISGSLRVLHKPDKPYEQSRARNLAIIEHEYRRSARSRDRHILFHYARELIGAGQREAAIPLLMSVLDDFSRHPELNYVYETAEALARYYTYNDKGEIGVIRPETATLGERFARIAVAASDLHAEPLVFIGDTYNVREDLARAKAYYKAAIQKQFGTGGFQDRDYYEFLPASRLSTIYKDDGELEDALWYNKLVLRNDPANRRAISERKDIVCQLLRGVL